jgi:hypothetical protein
LVSYYFKKWEEDPLVATDIKRISHTPNHVSIVVSQIQKFVFSMVVKRRVLLILSPAASISFQKRRNRFLQRLSKLPVLLLTNTCKTKQEEKVSTLEFVFTHGTQFVSIRCFHALEQIDFSKV